MAYADDWDVTTPTGGSPFASGDDKIRELKRALDERMASVFTNWPDGDPLEYAGGVVVSSGLASERPNPPAAADRVWFSTDTNENFVSIETDEEGVFAWDGPYGTTGPDGSTSSSAQLSKASYNNILDLAIYSVPVVTVRQLHIVYTGYIEVSAGILRVPLGTMGLSPGSEFYHVTDLLGLVIGSVITVVGSTRLYHGREMTHDEDTNELKISCTLQGSAGTVATSGDQVKVNLVASFTAESSVDE